MSNTPVQEPPVQEPSDQEPSVQALSTDSEQTLPSRPFQPISDPSASKRVCFYKSGDYTFSGHRMVINARTFKTFDALLDALSKKVPLPFGVRTITTPRGTNLVKALEDLHDGGSYVCSDQRRVKPLNLDEVNRRQVPWNTTRPFSAGRRKLQRLQSGQFRRMNEVANRPTRITERAAVRTPKRLEVIKNRDPTVKRTIVLQRRTAPTFDALLDYLSQVLQFPVLKLFSTDGRRVEGLAALILCSGVVVAAGNEAFRLGNYSSRRVGQMAQATYMDTVEPSMLQPRALNNKSFSSGRGSRNFSLSSERYIVNQINKSRSGSTNSHLQPRNRSFETEANHQRTSFETCETGMVNNEQHASIVPQDDDIEKSFRVNQDGSMTVEMKVRLTVKEEEMLHWTTTLSRSSLSKRTVCASISESGKSSTDSNNAVAKNSSSISGDELKEGNHPAAGVKGVKFNDERAMGKAKTAFKRSPTPGAQQVKRASVESVKMVTESGVQESTLGHYSYMERTAGGEKTEGYRVVRHSSSNRPIPKPRKTPSAGAINKGSHSSIRSSGVAEVLQIQNNGMEVTETVMHIYESQGSYDNYYANEEYSADGAPSYSSTTALESKPSLDSAPPSSSNDCDIDFSSQQPTRDSLQRQKEEMLSLSSEPITQTQEITNHPSSVTKREAQRKAKVKTPKTERNKIIVKPAKNLKSLTSTSSSEIKQKKSRGSPSKNGVQSSTDKLSSNTSMGKKSLSSSESVQNVQRSNGTEKPQFKKTGKDGQKPRKEQALIVNAVSVKRNPTVRQNMDKTAAKNNGHNVNSPTARPQMKKNMSDILQPKKSLLPARKTIKRPKSMTEHKLSPPKKSLELSESLSTPSFKPSLSEIHQYVENWLEKVSPDPVPYTEETNTDDSRTQTKVVFQIGADSESDEKTEGQTTKDECCPVPGIVKKSASCLTVPQCHADPTLLHNEQYARGLCVSMPSVRVDSAQMENVMRWHKSAEAIGPADNEASSSHFLSPHAKLKPVLNQIYSSIQCIRGVSETNTTSNLEKSMSLPDFPTQVASVFGSSCKAFLSFLSVMTLRDNLKESEEGVGDQSRSDPEAMLMMQSLQKISAIEDTEELRASLTDLQSRASSQLRARWKDFQILRERLESEPLSPRVSETEFALDVVSEGGDVFEEQHLGIDELMEEMNMPQELRAEICSTIQHSRFFYPVEESTFIETERNQSDSEEDVEKFVEERNDESEQSPEHDSSTMVTASEKELAEVQKTDTSVKESDISQTERDDLVNDKEREKEEQEDEGDNGEELKDGEDEVAKEIDEYKEGAESEAGEMESEEEVEEKHDDKGQEGGDEEEGSEEEEESVVKVEEGTEEEMKEDEEEEEEEVEEEEGGLLGIETEVVEVTEDGLMNEEDQESGEGISVEETDEREGDEETEKEENVDIEVDRGTEEEENEEDEAEEEGNEETEVEKDVKVEVRGVDEGDEEMEGEENVEEEVDEEPEDKEKVEDEGDEETEKEENVDVEADRGTEEEESEEDEADDDDTEEEGNEETEVLKDIEEEVKGVDEVHKETEEEEEHVEEEVDKETEEEDKVEDEGDEEMEKEENVDVEVARGTEEEESEEDEAEDDDTEEEGNEETEVEKDIEEEVKGVDEVHKETEEEENVEEEVDKETEEEDKEVDDDEETEEEERVEEEVDDETEGEEEEEEEEEVENIEELKQDDEESDDFNEVSAEGIREKVEEEGMKNIIKEKDLEDEVENITEDDVIEKREEEEEINEEEDEEEGKEEEVGETLGNFEEDEKYSEGGESWKNLQKTENTLEEESVVEAEVVEGIEIGEEKHESDVQEEDVSDAESKNVLEEALYLQQQSSCEEDTKVGEHNPESLSNYSSEIQCADDKGDGTDTVDELETDEGGEHQEEPNRSQPHPVEISQELLDFVNSALQCASLIFTYDAHGKIRIEPDNSRVVKTNQTSNSKSRKDSSYGVKCLPSPECSDLSDYRPETSESGGYQTQESIDIVSESGEEGSQRQFPVCRRKTDIPNSKLSVASDSKVLQNSHNKSGGSFSSFDSVTKASKEDLSYFSAGSSQKAETEAAREATQCSSFPSEKDSKDGVLIDQGRWLLKENHLIRTSPPVSLGMYNNVDSTSIDTSHSRSSEDSLPHYKTQQNLLAALSSSELEEMAKPKTPKCTYYNMPHGSDSDPFLDDSSLKSGKKNTRSVKGKGVRVAPTINTTQTWANKNGSLSSFASVEFNIPDRKVHPEGEASSLTMARRTSGGEGRAVQAQDSIDTLHVRCGQYCPIL